MRILVADDDPTSRHLAQTALGNLGHECRSVANGAEAWESFLGDRPDVVISDWMMPGLTGLELCRNIRARTSGDYTYFIMVTCHGDPDEILEGMSAGADDYLVKPLDFEDLQARLVAAARVTSLDRKRADQRTELERLNQELTVIARRDPLTGLANRRALEEDLALLEARHGRQQRYCIALVDVDHFKRYNDANGHPAGDQILRIVAAQIRNEARAGDVLYRYGGEEFLCILPEQSLATGIAAVERMRKGVERLAIPHDHNPSGVLTISAGLASLDAAHSRSPTEVVQQADDALYRAKRRGRNCIEVALAEGQPDGGIDPVGPVCPEGSRPESSANMQNRSLFRM